MKTTIHEPTTRKVHNRGWTPIRYRAPGAHGSARNGWIIEEDAKHITVQLIGDEKPKHLPIKERKFIRTFDQCAAAAADYLEALKRK